MVKPLLLALLVAAPFTASAHVDPETPPAGPAQTQGGQGRENGERLVTVRIGDPLRPLPFRLNLASSEAPHSLSQMVGDLYDALPERHLRMIAAFFGGDGYRSLRSRYSIGIDFYYDLYIPEILTEATNRWHNPDNPGLSRSRRCVGPDFGYLTAIQIGVRYMDLHRTERDPPPSDRAAGFIQANLAARRLFEVCDRSQP